MLEPSSGFEDMMTVPEMPLALARGDLPRERNYKEFYNPSTNTAWHLPEEYEVVKFLGNGAYGQVL